MTTETFDILLGARVSKRLNDKIIAEQQRIAEMTGIKPSINEVVRMLLEKALESNGAKGKRR
jgi:antitoxin component of RelBE/YafQ-DinJ toxin-antitoxin module